MNTCIIPTFFHPVQTYAILFPGFVLSLTLTLKINKTLETSLDLMPLFKTSLDERIKDLVSNVDYLENWRRNFIQKKYGRKRDLQCTHVCFSGLSFSFCLDFFHHWWVLKVKKRLFPNSLNSFYYFFIIWFEGLSFKIQFKVEFWPLVNRGQLVLE